ncbi:MAG: hypothetical protein RLY93_12885 [Sumerlaeia bacterium]
MSLPPTDQEALALPDAMLDQDEVQKRLDALTSQTGELSGALDALEAWSQRQGYFAHLTRPNLYLQERDDEYGVTFRLQVNYSRLGYRPADRMEDQPENPLCWENVASPWKPLLRAFEFESAGVRYFAHATPFPLHKGHFVMNVRDAEPMRMDERSLREMAGFLARAPRWLAASNSDVAWAGASVLAHQHLQLFRKLSLPVETAREAALQHHHGCTVEWLHWPCPVARLRGAQENVIVTGGELIRRWKATDPGQATCNLLLRADGHSATAHVFLRHPDFRTPDSLRFIKSEGVGIIEVAGEIIVPPQERLSLTENRNFFRTRLLEIARGIIGGNGPEFSLAECQRLLQN